MRKTQFFSVLLILLFCGESVLAQTAMFRNGIGRTGVYDSCQINAPIIAWKFRTQGQILSSPVVENKTLFTGSNDGNLYAVNTTNGKLKWKFKTKGAISSTPAVDGDIVAFVSFDGNFYALDKNSGKEKWKFKTEGEQLHAEFGFCTWKPISTKNPDPWDFFTSSPVFHDGKVYFGSGDYHIYCLNAKTGAVVWKFKTQDVVHASPAIYKGKVYVGSFDGHFYALNAKTGEKVWKFMGKEDNKWGHCLEGFQASPAVKDGVVYCGSRDTYMYAFNAENGNILWKTKNPVNSWFTSSVAIRGDKLFCGSSDAKKFYVFDKNTGAILHEHFVGTLPFSSPAISGRTVFMGSLIGNLYAFDAETWKEKWKISTYSPLASVYFDEKGEVNEAAFTDLPYNSSWNACARVERLKSGSGGILSSPTVANGRVYFTSLNGFIYAVGGKRIKTSFRTH